MGLTLCVVAYLAFLSILVNTAESSLQSSFTDNVAFDGPFGSHDGANRRRLQELWEFNGSFYGTDIEFYHGVASGEPTDTDALIWTRVTPPFQDQYGMDRNDTFNATQLDEMKSLYHTLAVQWVISSTPESIDFNCTRFNGSGDTLCGTTLTSMDVDYTVKVIVDGLSPDSWHYYQFKVGNNTSDIGRTRTLPTNDTVIDSWRFAVSSCKQFAHGFFNNLGDIAGRDDLDMMVWLGDYIYEFPNSGLVNG